MTSKSQLKRLAVQNPPEGDTPRTDALINLGAPSQNQYITAFIKLARDLERDLAAAQAKQPAPAPASYTEAFEEWWDAPKKHDVDLKGRYFECWSVAKADPVPAADLLESLSSRLSESEAECAKARKDAERWQEIKKQFAPLGANIDGNHAWQWRGNPARLKGPNMEAAIDAALVGIIDLI